MRLFDGYLSLQIAQEASFNAVLVSGIVSSYLKKNFVPASQLMSLISVVAQTLADVRGQNPVDGAPLSKPLQPAVPIRQSITEDFIICLEDGKRFKSLKRHLAVKYNMTPDEYRAKWSLASDYPMVSPSYTRVRSRLAKAVGLGRKH